MDRRKFLQRTSLGLSALGVAAHIPVSANEFDHPNVIDISPSSDSIATDIQAAFLQAYQLWQNDTLSRRPVIRLPAGQFFIDDIVGNNRGNYPFHMPPTFKLIGAGSNLTHITARQPRGNQYRFLMIYPNTRLDVLAQCPSLQKSCVFDEVTAQGPSFDVEISGITFNEFDNAISLKEARDCYIHDCEFNGSLVAVQLDMDHQFGNKGHRFERCKFDAQAANGSWGRFSLRFEAPYSNLWVDVEQGVQDLQGCIALGGDHRDYSASRQECTVPSDDKLSAYLEQLFGANLAEDIGNRNCDVVQCDFYHSDYSAIEFAGKLNIENHVYQCGFYQCDGTGVEFDKGASHNKVTHCVFSGLRPTTTFAPSIPYIFQAAVQEQEGSHSVDARLKSLIQEQGYDSPPSANFKGEDIFLRSASLPQNNEIAFNQFDVGRSYWLSDIEPNASQHHKLPDVYPSVRLRRSMGTKIIGNIEFNATPSLQVLDDSVLGQSLVIYQNDEIRDHRGGIEIKDNVFAGAWYFVGIENGMKDNLPMLVENNQFGFADGLPRGGFNHIFLNAEQVTMRNNVFHCARNVNSTVLKEFDISTFDFIGNQIEIPTANSVYIRSIETNDTRNNLTNIVGNTFNGGHAMYIYDYTASPNGSAANDSLIFNNNAINGMSGAGRVVALTLWAKHIEINSNEFNDIENKVFQLYALSDTFNHDGQNSLVLAATSQNRAYSRNYANSRGGYVTNEFWVNT